MNLQLRNGGFGLAEDILRLIDVQLARSAALEAGLRDRQGLALFNNVVLGNFDLLLLSTIVMALLVVCVNRLVWRRLYRLSETRFRLET